MDVTSGENASSGSGFGVMTGDEAFDGEAIVEEVADDETDSGLKSKSSCKCSKSGLGSGSGVADCLIVVFEPLAVFHERISSNISEDDDDELELRRRLSTGTSISST